MVLQVIHSIESMSICNYDAKTWRKADIEIYHNINWPYAILRPYIWKKWICVKLFSITFATGAQTFSEVSERIRAYTAGGVNSIKIE